MPRVYDSVYHITSGVKVWTPNETSAHPARSRARWLSDICQKSLRRLWANITPSGKHHICFSPSAISLSSRTSPTPWSERCVRSTDACGRGHQDAGELGTSQHALRPPLPRVSRAQHPPHLPSLRDELCRNPPPPATPPQHVKTLGPQSQPEGWPNSDHRIG